VITTIHIDKVYKDDNRKDVRIEYHNVETGRKGSIWYDEFKLHGRFQPAPAAERASHAAAPDATDAEALRRLVATVQGAMASIGEIVSRLK
jgi:hypothetical protein